jgi:hypothetical protein
MRGWIDLFINRILADTVGETLAPVVFVALLVLLGATFATPFVVLWISRQVNAMRRVLATTEEKLDRLAARNLEIANQVKESFALVQERLAGTPPPVRFGPEDSKGAPAEAAGAEGKGVYNYCPGCKEIRFIKFLRCQTCGFHIPS